MKLFIWNRPYAVMYGSSCIYVVAETEEEARQELKRTAISQYGYDPDKVGDLSQDRPPDRVVSAPYAEAYEWSE